MKKLNYTQLSKKWKCNERTIRRWEAEGAPLADAAGMRNWLATRKHVPPGTERLVAKSPPSPSTPAAAVAIETGAGPALARLESSEAAAFEAFEAAVKSGDATRIKATRQTWLAVGEQLRRFDAGIGDSRRVTGEVVKRDETERILRAVSCWWNSAIAASVDPLLNAVVAGRLSGELIRKTLVMGWHGSIAAGARACSGITIPSWAADALLSGHWPQLDPGWREAFGELLQMSVSKIPDEIRLAAVEEQRRLAQLIADGERAVAELRARKAAESA